MAIRKLFFKAALNLELEDQATLFTNEEPVYLEGSESSWFGGGVTQVRRPGETQAYWIPDKAFVLSP